MATTRRATSRKDRYIATIETAWGFLEGSHHIVHREDLTKLDQTALALRAAKEMERVSVLFSYEQREQERLQRVLLEWARDRV